MKKDDDIRAAYGRSAGKEYGRIADQELMARFSKQDRWYWQDVPSCVSVATVVLILSIVGWVIWIL